MFKAALLASLWLLAACADPVPLTAGVELAASQSEVVGATVQLVVTVTNTGPLIPHLGLVFRTADRWYEVHRVTDLAGCTIAAEASAFDCGDLAAARPGPSPSAGSPRPRGPSITSSGFAS